MGERRQSWVDGFGYELKTLQDLMESRGTEAIQQLNAEFGGLQELAHGLKTNLTDGLSGDEADLRSRRELYGSNMIPAKEPKSFLELVWEALHDFTLIVLVVAAVISLILGLVVEKDKSTSWIDGFAILMAVVVVVLVTAFNDYSKELQFQSLQKQIKQNHTFAVIRNGQIIRINVTDLVVGDVISFSYGDAMPADGILIQGNDVRVDESSMTGENDYIRKGPTRDVVMLSSTQVMEGSGKMLVCAVGVNSQAGIIFTLINKGGRVEKENGRDKETPGSDSLSMSGENDLTKRRASAAAAKEQETMSQEKSVLQNKLTKLAVQIGYGGTIAAVLSTIVLLLRFCIETYVIEGKGWESHHASEILDSFIVGVTVLVVAIPEGLPLAVTIALAYSVKKMMTDHNLVRHLHACETMGNATAICSDKTGTLTTNRMTVVQSYLGKTNYGHDIKQHMLGGHLLRVLCDGIAVNSGYSSRIMIPDNPDELPKQAGNKTECALLQFCDSLGEEHEQIREKHTEDTFTKVFTFNAIRKSMTTVIPHGNGYRVFTKGASEVVLGKCSYIIGAEDQLYPLPKQEQRHIVGTVIETMASQGLRTLCLAYKDVPHDAIESDDNWDDEHWVTSDLTCVGIVGIEDPVRDEVPEAISKVQNAGVTVRMVTGDNINTAQAIATKCGILTSNDDKDFAVMSGKEFNKRVRGRDGVVNQDLMDAVWPGLRVLARSSPEDKHTLVTGIIKSEQNKHREVVAVTGDGTNDGPALKVADVGFAMGIAGTDVAKEASDIVLTDDNFASIVKAVMWGRNVYDSIAKFIQFQLTVNVVAVTLVFISACTIKELPLTPIQMLWVNLIMDSLASLALATEPPTEDLLTRKPYGRTKPLISRTMFRNIAMHSIFQLTVVFVLVFAGADLFDIDTAIGRDDEHEEPTQHFTIVFNTFVLMQIFNEINSRKVHGERNVFKGIPNNPFFMVIFVATLALQILIVEYGSYAFSTHPLEPEQWLWCVFFGMSSLVWGQIVTTVPKHPMPQLGKTDKDDEGNQVDSGIRDARILWMRGLWRLQAQIRVVHAFRSAIESQHTPKGSLRKPSDLMYPSHLHLKLRDAEAMEEGIQESSADVTASKSASVSNESCQSNEPLVQPRVQSEKVVSQRVNSLATETAL